jgi:multiple sugar transport system ATP-binding protein
VSAITLNGVSKTYPGNTPALRDLDLEIQDGEFLVLVGPSGCGKSTALRIIAGLEKPSAGTVTIGGESVDGVPSRDRDVAMVFQSYALYPHLTVFDNIAFGLSLRKLSKADIRRKVTEVAGVLRLTEQLDFKPGQLSGGQRQRVAMGRAIVREPRVFLMDEPLSNLDAGLRVRMRAQIARIQRDLGVTMVYVTHDQTEAMTLGDRVAVLRRGVLQQVGPPQELYERPVNLFVAGFIGSPGMNTVYATLRPEGDTYWVWFGAQRLKLPESVLHERPALKRYAEREVIAGIRPEDMTDTDFAPAGDGQALTSVADLVEPMGSDVLVHFPVEAATAHADEIAEFTQEKTATLLARFSPRTSVFEGLPITVGVNTARLHFFDPDTGAAIWRD